MFEKRTAGTLMMPPGAGPSVCPDGTGPVSSRGGSIRSMTGKLPGNNRDTDFNRREKGFPQFLHLPCLTTEPDGHDPGISLPMDADGGDTPWFNDVIRFPEQRRAGSRRMCRSLPQVCSNGEVRFQNIASFFRELYGILHTTPAMMRRIPEHGGTADCSVPSARLRPEIPENPS